ncbi:MAG: hypothetical protein MUP66_03220, partial [Candidatus Nanohaloarchaeota archaeon QJJ-5]|nr:hypothetical protein [Candidatus Nanohaloarchaeota archaeon QJJ-5]
MSEYIEPEKVIDDLYENSLLEICAEQSSGTYLPALEDDVDPGFYLRSVAALHFHEEYGSQYARDLEDKLHADEGLVEQYGEDFDVPAVLDGYDDLVDVFSPDMIDEDILYEQQATYFVPDVFLDDRGRIEDPKQFDLSESSGNTGPKKVSMWSKQVSDYVADWYEFNVRRGAEPEGDWLVNGPYGLFQKHHETFTGQLGGSMHFMGLETRGLKGELKDLGDVMQIPPDLSINPVQSVKKIGSAVSGLMRMRPTMQTIEERLQKDPIENISGAYQTVDRVHDMLDDEGTVSSPDDINTILLSGIAFDEDIVEDIDQKYAEADIVPMYATSFTGPN